MKTKLLQFHIITLFPEVVKPYLESSVLGRAIKQKKIKVSLYNPRDFTHDRNRRVDDKPYGGGPGMVMQAEPILKAVSKAVGRKKDVTVIFFTPSGTQFDAKYAKKLATRSLHLVMIAGHYEGVDERVVKALKAKKVSIGPYTLTGGELPALAVLDSVSREVEGVLGNIHSPEHKRVASAHVYTRPEVIKHDGKVYRVPKVLLSGSHSKIEDWRKRAR